MLISAWFFAILGVLVLLIAAVGILRLPDALARQHAATKAATLSISLFAIGLMWFAMASGWDWGWIARIVILLLLLMLTLPLAAHALARSALSEHSGQPLEKNHIKLEIND